MKESLINRKSLIQPKEFFAIKDNRNKSNINNIIDNNEYII